jgi:hypothetical protein
MLEVVKDSVDVQAMFPYEVLYVVVAGRKFISSIGKLISGAQA